MYCHDEPTMPGEAPARQHLFHALSFQRQQQRQKNKNKEKKLRKEKKTQWRQTHSEWQHSKNMCYITAEPCFYYLLCFAEVMFSL